MSFYLNKQQEKNFILRIKLTLELRQTIPPPTGDE